MERHYFNPTPDTTYENKGGGSYICLEAEGNFRAKFQRVGKYKWTGEPPEPNFPMCSVPTVYIGKKQDQQETAYHCKKTSSNSQKATAY